MARNNDKNASEKERKRVIELHMIGHSISDMARMLGRSIPFVKKTWAKRHWPSLKDKQRKKRAGKLTPAGKGFFTKFVKEKLGIGYRKATRALTSCDINGEKVHASFVHRFIKSQPWGKKSYKMEVKPLRNATQTEKRLSACNNWHRNGYLDDSDESKAKRMNILWTDEKNFELFPKPNKQNMRMRFETKANVPVARVVKDPLKIMVAGGMTGYGLTN